MPMYDYQCGCGLQFERRAAINDHMKSKQCPSCGGAAQRVLPSTLHSVVTSTVSGPSPQNTGFHDYDTHIDRVIGQSAQNNWRAHEKRRDEKLQVLERNPGTRKEELSREPDGSWRVMAPEETYAQWQARRINSEAMERLQRRRSTLSTGSDSGDRTDR